MAKARTAAEISNAIRTNLRVLDPDISTEPLTPERKIIDTVAEIIAESEVDIFVQDYAYDIDTKAGADLDKFVALFGFARQGGHNASGTVTFSRFADATLDLVIPVGTQVVKPSTSVSNAVTFQTTAPATIYTGTTSADTPIECSVPGTIGNVAAHTITVIGTVGGLGISAVDNADPTTGGTGLETDAELRIRFKNTIFRNIAGTADQFLALAIASRFSNKANVIGPISRFSEFLQISGGTAQSIIPYSKFTWDFDYWLTDGVYTSETFFAPKSVDYKFNTTVAPSITVTNPTQLPNGKIVLLEHTYTSQNSRNDPSTNKMNYVDVYVSGYDPTIATESCLFPPAANNFVTTATSDFYNGKYQRVINNNLPSTINRLQWLMWQPTTALPGTITIGANTYTLNTHYWLIRDTTLTKGSRRARNGIEWDSTVMAVVTAGTPFQIDYTFNRLPITLNELMEDHKQITTDVLVHSALDRFYRIALTIMYSAGFSKIAVDQAVTTALIDFLEKQTFGAVIQISDILEIAHQVPGVDNVRITTQVESNTTYGIQEIAADGVTVLSTTTLDFTLPDSDLPVLYDVVAIAKSQNTWINF